MNDPKKPQFASVEYPFPLEEPPVVYCPVCGNPTFNLDDGGNWIMNPCQHLAFIFNIESSAFDHKSKDFEKRATGIDVDTLSDENLKAFLEFLEYDNKLLVLEVTHGGIGNGQVWYTEIYGFDFGLYQ